MGVFVRQFIEKHCNVLNPDNIVDHPLTKQFFAEHGWTIEEYGTKGQEINRMCKILNAEWEEMDEEESPPEGEQ